MVAGDIQKEKQQLPQPSSFLEMRKTFITTGKTSQRSATMTQSELKKFNKRTVDGNSPKKDYHKKTTRPIDRKFLLHESLNDSTEVEQHQTVDLTTLSQFSGSISTNEKSGRNTDFGSASLFIKTSESKEDDSRKQSVSL